jgi:hypothetical protein
MAANVPPLGLSNKAVEGDGPYTQIQAVLLLT